MIKLHVLNKRRVKEGWTEANCHDAYISIYSERFILKILDVRMDVFYAICKRFYSYTQS